MTDGKKGITEFSVSRDVQRIVGMRANAAGYDPAVVPPIVDPSARSYADRIQERAAARKAASTLKGKSPPLGHVEFPSSEKMEAIARVHELRDETRMVRPPEEEDEKPVTGVGAGLAFNRALSERRFKKGEGPLTLREAAVAAPKQGLSPESIKALEMAAKTEQQPQEEAPEPEVKSTPSVAKETREELDRVEDSLAPELPLLDYSAIGEVKNSLMGKKRREDIESRLSPLDIGDMIMKRELVQTIPVIPGKFEVTLRTFNQRENLWILKYVYDFTGSALYIQELINTCRLVCGIVSINGAFLPDHRKDLGLPTEQVSKADFEKKFFHVASFPVQLVADLSVQSLWFQDRVDKLFTIETLKNG